MSGVRFQLTGQRLELLRALRQEQGLGEQGRESIPRLPDREHYPLSFGQQRLWFLDRLQPGGAAYNLRAALRLRGEISAGAFRRALSALALRQASLRTTFGTVEGKEGEEEPAQRLTPPGAAWPVPLVDLAGIAGTVRLGIARRIAGREAERPFDLEHGPMLRVLLVRIEASEHVLVATMHHIATDGWSMDLLARELTSLYRGEVEGRPAPLATLPIRYADYAAWQRGRAQSGALDGQLAYWREHLAGAPLALELPTDRPRPPVPSFRGAVAGVDLPPSLVGALYDLGHRAQATPFMVLLALYGLLLREHADPGGTLADVLVGTPIANRQRPEVEGLIGFFANTLVLRVEVGGDPTFSELLARVRAAAVGAQAHQDLPFERLVEELHPERSLSHTPLFQAMLVVEHAAPSASSAPLSSERPTTAVREAQALALQPMQVPGGAARFDWTLAAIAGDRSLHLTAEYATDLFDPATARRMLARLQALAEGAAATPDRPISNLSLLQASERHQALLEWNDWTLGEPEGLERWREPLLHRLFEEWVARDPRRLAVSCDEVRWSYAELEASANRLGRFLRLAGAGPESVVAIALSRSPWQIAGILAVLKAGAAYLPLDREAPDERLASALADARVAIVLADAEDAERFAALGATPVCPELESEALAALEAGPLPGGALADNPAYVLFTSGSTGRPKGVVVSHRAASATLLWRLAQFALIPEDTILQNISVTFDPSVWQIFGALLSGAHLALLPPAERQDFAALARRIAAERATITDLAPSMLQVFLEQEGLDSCGSLRLLFVGGEALPPALADRFHARFPRAALQNIYGPTEAAIDALTWTHRSRPGARVVPIGRPAAGKRLFVLDPRFAPTPIGVPGELFIGCGPASSIGGAGLARGYIGRPDLTAERFVPCPRGLGRAGSEAGERLYRTGDLVRQMPDGAIEFLGRVDRQVKVRGFRIELGEVETAIGRHPEVREVFAATVRDERGESQLAAWFAPAWSPTAAEQLRAFLRALLPSYMVPISLAGLAQLPRNASGKVDPQALPEPRTLSPIGSSAHRAPTSELERSIAAVWREVLDVAEVGLDDNFFDLGGHSLLLVRVHGRLRKLLDREIAILELFSHPTVGTLAEHLASGLAPDRALEAAQARGRAATSSAGSEPIAIVGMAGRFPGARDVEELWGNLRAGRESIRFFSDEELLAAGFGPKLLARPDYVKARGALDDVDLWDAGFFDVGAREAEALDPQQRLFLEVAWEALERAGCDPSRDPGRLRGPIGVFAGVSASTYLVRNLLGNREALLAIGLNQAFLGGEKDFLATRVSYKLDLAGPSLTVQTACSTSLVAVHLACRSLLARECDVALAGGSSIAVPQTEGYLFQEGGIHSPDGHCRAFDAGAAGTVSGSGVGVVVLRRLADALAEGDPIVAVIRGTAINNDGAGKVGYTAPSVEGQAEVIAAAQAAAGVAADTIGYVEAHGTGTPLGDPIEVAALTRAFGLGTERRGFCALGSIKTNVGHLDAAAGVAGLIKAALALDRGEIPPSLHFERPNPAIDFAATPFSVSDMLTPWPRGERPRRAGVSSFGIGGTNVHAVLEEAPEPVKTGSTRPVHLIALSAKSDAALEAATDRFAEHLDTHPEQDFADVTATLQTGRKAFSRRRVLVARDRSEAARALRDRDPERVLTLAVPSGRRAIAFLFPGQGTQYLGMGRGLYRAEPAFRAAFDACSEAFAPHLDPPLEPSAEKADLRRLLGFTEGSEPVDHLVETALAQPALFAVEVALARLWEAWGIRPQAMLGHSIGEWTAAHLAGVFSLEDAARLVALRGRSMQVLPRGAMLAVPLPEAEVLSLLAGSSLALAAINAPRLAVVSGAENEIEAFDARLAESGIEGRRLHTSHAFHSAAMDPVLAPFAEAVRSARLAPPRIPFLSNVTGTWIESEEATSPDYWARHLRAPVRFAEGVAELLAEPNRLLLEVGPGDSLARLARRQAPHGTTIVSSLRAATETGDDQGSLLVALGRLWLVGVEIDWAGFQREGRRRKVVLPTYPFERRRYWIDPAPLRRSESSVRKGRKEKIENWFSVPVWRETFTLETRSHQVEERGEDRRSWLIFADERGVGDRLAAKLRDRGERVVRVQEGESFARLADDTFAIHPGRREDSARLLAALAADGPLPDRAVHLWSLTGEVEAPIERTLDRAFYGLLGLAQALGERMLGGSVDLAVVADGLVDVAGETRVDARKAALLGPVRALPLESPGVSCRAIDVAFRAGFEDLLASSLLAELDRPPDEPVVALRGTRRFVERFEALRLPLAGEARRELREGGVVLVTGGTSGIGLEIASHLAATRQARLALLARTALPPRDAWDDLLAGPETELRSRIERLAALEATGVEVLLLEGDLAGEEAVAAMVAAVRARFGAVHGVIHAAGRPGRGLIQRKSFEQAAAVLAPKVQGTLALAKALVGETTLDFFVVFSSLASLFGGVGQADYAAANAFLDAFAAGEASAGRPVLAIDWDAWREVGMAARSAAAGEPGVREMNGLSTREGLEAFDRALGSGLPRVIVATRDLGELRSELERAPAPAIAAESIASVGPVAHPRPALATAYVAPRNETERKLAAIWEEVLGVAPIGLHDDFADLGGHSLLALQVLARIRHSLTVELTLAALFEAPTVARLAVRLLEGESEAADGAELEALLAEIGEISDEEAEALLAPGAGVERDSGESAG